MEIVRAKPRRIFIGRIEQEDHKGLEQSFSEELHCLKRFISSMLSGNDCSSFCRFKLHEFVRECVALGRAEFLVKEIDSLLENLIRQLLTTVDYAPFEASPNRQMNKMALKHFDPSRDLTEHYYLFTKFEICWCSVRMALSEIIKVCDALESASHKSKSGFTLLDKAIAHFAIDKDLRPQLYRDVELGLLALVRSYRQGRAVNFCQLFNVVEIFTCLEMFDSLENKLLEETASYYRTLSAEHLAGTSFSDCYRKFSSIIESEKKSCAYYLNPDSTKRVIEVVRKELLFDNCEKLVNPQNLKELLKNDDLESIVLVNSLYLKTRFNKLLFDNIFVSSKEICSDLLSSYLARRDFSECHRFTLELHNHQDRLDRLLQPIMSSSDYSNRLNSFWTSMLNQSDEVIEYVTLSLAKHADELFMEHPNELEGKLSFMLHMFQYLSNKSYFEICYRSLVSMRLLYDKALNRVHFDTISLLKQECGANYVCKLNDVTDFYKASKDLMDEFKEHLLSVPGAPKPPKSRQKGGSASQKAEVPAPLPLDLVNEFDFTVTLVSLDSWIYKKIKTSAAAPSEEQFDDAEVMEMDPAVPDLTSNYLPQRDYVSELVILHEKFREMHTTKFKKRALEYYPHLGSVEMELTFKVLGLLTYVQGRCYRLGLSVIQSFELILPSYIQAFCLLLFNNYKFVNLEQLQSVFKTGYNDSFARTHLAPLSSEEVPLLKFYQPTMDFTKCNLKDYFELNLDFWHEKLELDLRPAREELLKTETNYVTTARRFEDMVPFVESTIVRYLKQTFEASSVTLFKMFSKNPNFTLSRDQFNKVIDSLVAREFIQFNKTNKEFLQYMA